MQTHTDIESYISSFPQPVQNLLGQIRRTILEVMPEAEEVMRYGLPTFRLHGKNVIHFGAFKKHIGIYPTPSAIGAFATQLEPYAHAKGSIIFPYTQPFPFEILQKLAEYRLQEVEKSSSSKQ